MYIPSYYKENDEQKLIEFMQAYHFATLISTKDSNICATHLPFVIEKRGEKLILVCHMAKANPQWEAFTQNEVLVIFQGPHAYISPTHYEKQQNVPTWNYIAVHATGKTKIISEPTEVIALMEKTINHFEKGFYEQWKNLSPEYVNGMLKAIIGFEIEVTKLEGKFKLSQNKTKNEQQNIVESLGKSEDTAQAEVAKEMKKKL